MYSSVGVSNRIEIRGIILGNKKIGKLLKINIKLAQGTISTLGPKVFFPVL